MGPVGVGGVGGVGVGGVSNAPTLSFPIAPHTHAPYTTRHTSIAPLGDGYEWATKEHKGVTMGSYGSGFGTVNRIDRRADGIGGIG